jgi:OOP family OmpA-OmpF porin
VSPELEIAVEGHTDSVGSLEYNLDLSHRRATSVRAYLVSQGLSAEAIDAAGFGERRPVASNDTEAGRELNRRVEIVLGEPGPERASSSARDGRRASSRH